MTNAAHAIHDPAHWDSVAERYAAEAERMTARYAEAALELAAYCPARACWTSLPAPGRC